MTYSLETQAYPPCECPRCRPAREREARELEADLARLTRQAGSDADTPAS
ncbi:hypothetical protein [Streptomyces sp. NPDC007083]